MATMYAPPHAFAPLLNPCACMTHGPAFRSGISLGHLTAGASWCANGSGVCQACSICSPPDQPACWPSPAHRCSHALAAPCRRRFEHRRPHPAPESRWPALPVLGTPTAPSPSWQGGPPLLTLCERHPSMDAPCSRLRLMQHQMHAQQRPCVWDVFTAAQCTWFLVNVMQICVS